MSVLPDYCNAMPLAMRHLELNLEDDQLLEEHNKAPDETRDMRKGGCIVARRDIPRQVSFMRC